MNHLQNAQNIFEEFPDALGQKQVGFRPMVDSDDILSESPFLKDLAACTDELESFNLSKLLEESSTLVFFQSFFVYPMCYFEALLTIPTNYVDTEALFKRYIKTFRKKRIQHQSVQDWVEIQKEETPNLTEIEISYVEETDLSSRRENALRPLVGVAETWLKMRFHQLRVATLFSAKFTAACRGILNTFQSREGPVHPYVAILETEVRILILFANHRFQRAFELATQTAEAIGKFLNGGERPPQGLEQIRRNILPDPPKNEFIQYSSLPNAEIFSGIFPLTETTELDRVFDFTEFTGFTPSNGPEGPAYYINAVGNRVTRQEYQIRLFDRVVEKLDLMDGTEGQDPRVELLERFRATLFDTEQIRERAVNKWKRAAMSRLPLNTPYLSKKKKTSGISKEWPSRGPFMRNPKK